MNFATWLPNFLFIGDQLVHPQIEDRSLQNTEHKQEKRTEMHTIEIDGGRKKAEKKIRDRQMQNAPVRVHVDAVRLLGTNRKQQDQRYHQKIDQFDPLGENRNRLGKETRGKNGKYETENEIIHRSSITRKFISLRS